jgi:hypothetical protein
MRGSRGDVSHVVRCGDCLQRLSVKTTANDNGIGTMIVPRTLRRFHSHTGLCGRGTHQWAIILQPFETALTVPEVDGWRKKKCTFVE